MKYVAVFAIWLGFSGALAAMAYSGVFSGPEDATLAILFGGIVAVLGTLAITDGK